jgi:hypothetical protein
MSTVHLQLARLELILAYATSDTPVSPIRQLAWETALLLRCDSHDRISRRALDEFLARVREALA